MSDTDSPQVIDLTGWPAGMRVGGRAERPHPGAQLRFTDIDGHRLTAFATNSAGSDLPELELRHRHRARCEDRIRGAKDTGLRSLPLHDFVQNRIWLAYQTRIRAGKISRYAPESRRPFGQRQE